MFEGKYKEFHLRLQTIMSKDRIVTDPVGTFAYGTDASFYRLIPKMVTFVDNEEEVREVGGCECHVRGQGGGWVGDL